MSKVVMVKPFVVMPKDSSQIVERSYGIGRYRRRDVIVRRTRDVGNGSCVYDYTYKFDQLFFDPQNNCLGVFFSAIWKPMQPEQIDLEPSPSPISA